MFSDPVNVKGPEFDSQPTHLSFILFCGFWFLWYSLTAFRGKWLLGSQVFAVSSYPDHLTRYLFSLFMIWQSNILSNSYSGSSVSGSRGIEVSVGVSGCAGSNSDTWNTGCIFMFFGNWSS